MSQSVRPPDVVESFLLGVHADPHRHEVSFTFRTPDRKREFRLSAQGVDHLLIAEFMQQNIVQGVNTFGPGSNPTQTRNLLATLMFDSAQACDVVDLGLQAKLEECANAVLEGHKVLLEIEPVYGASVLLLGASVEWLDGCSAS